MNLSRSLVVIISAHFLPLSLSLLFSRPGEELCAPAHASCALNCNFTLRSTLYPFSVSFRRRRCHTKAEPFAHSLLRANLSAALNFHKLFFIHNFSYLLLAVDIRSFRIHVAHDVWRKSVPSNWQPQHLHIYNDLDPI